MAAAWVGKPTSEKKTSPSFHGCKLVGAAEALSFEAGLDVMTISRIERGILNVSVGDAYKIAVVLNIHYKDLFDFEIPEQNK